MSGIYVGNTQQLRDALAAGYTPEQLTMTDVEAIRVSARNEGFTAGQAASEERWREERNRIVGEAADKIHPDAKAEIIADERRRIAAIQGLTSPGLERIASDAIEQGCSLEQFALLQMKEIKDRGITLDAMRQDAPPAAAFAGAPEGITKARGIDASKIFRSRAAKQEDATKK